jgi:hypothetical protein
MSSSTRNIEPTLTCTSASNPHAFYLFEVALEGTDNKITEEYQLISAHEVALTSVSNIIMVDTIKRLNHRIRIQHSSHQVVLSYHNAHLICYELSEIKLTTFFPPSVRFEFSHLQAETLYIAPNLQPYKPGVPRQSRTVRNCSLRI